MVKAMEYTKEQIQQRWKESVKRQDVLEAEYRKAHGLTLSVSVSTPEIIAEEVEQNRLFHEYKEAYRRDEKEYKEYKNKKEHDSIRTGNENAVDGK